MPQDAEQAVLVGRLRVLLAGEAVVREVSMFGGRSFWRPRLCRWWGRRLRGIPADRYRPSGKRRASRMAASATGVNLEALALAHGESSGGICDAGRLHG